MAHAQGIQFKEHKLFPIHLPYENLPTEEKEKKVLEEILAPLQNYTPLSARDLACMQLKINYLRWIQNQDKKIPLPAHKKIPLHHDTMIQENVIFIPHSYTLFTRSNLIFPNISKIAAQHRQAKDYELTDKLNLAEAEREQSKPLEQRNYFILENQDTIITMETEKSNLFRWLLRDQADAVFENEKIHTFYGFSKEKRSSHHYPIIRGLWLSPCNNLRDPPHKKPLSLGSYLIGLDFFYTLQPSLNSNPSKKNKDP